MLSKYQKLWHSERVLWRIGVLLVVLASPVMPQGLKLLSTFWSIHNHYLEEELQSSAGGAQDFDFLTGYWKVHSLYRKVGLRGAKEWVEFDGRSEVKPLRNGLGNVGHYSGTRDGKRIEESTLRVFNPAGGDWSVFQDDAPRVRVLKEPIVGTFHGEKGEFFGNADVRGRTLRCRLIWIRADTRSPRCEQAFSEDGGRTWETKWIMTLTRDAHL